MRYALLLCGDEDLVVSPEDQAKEAAFTSLQEELRSEGMLLCAPDGPAAVVVRKAGR
jgi:hypothetical protein